MSAARIEAVLLDMGGVLIPEISGYDGAARDGSVLERLSEAGIPDPERLIFETGRRIREAYEALGERGTQPDPDLVLAELTPPVRALLLEAFGHQAAQPPYPHAREVVAELAQDYKLGLVSNTVIPGDHHARSLESAGLLQHLDAAVWSANFGTRKPDPAMVIHVLEKLGTPPEHAVLVGDKIRTDILAARRAGARAIWLRKSGAAHTGEAEPDFIIHDLRELPSLLRRLKG